MNLDQAADDLRDSARAVHDRAQTALAIGTHLGVSALRQARPPYPYRYAERIAASAKGTPPRRTKGGEVLTQQVKVGGRGQAFTGGASISQLVWGAEFGAKGGNVVRVTLSTGTTRTVQARGFSRYATKVSRQHTAITYTKTGKARRRTVHASRAGAQRTTVTGVRRGGLPQFPGRRRDGWFLTPALDRVEAQVWDTADQAFTRALQQGR